MVVRELELVEDASGTVQRTMVWRGLDTVAAMARRGTISAPMMAAAARFHDAFRRAGLDDLYAADPQRPIGCGSNRWGQGAGNERARTEVVQALTLLGGATTPTGSCTWHVVGCEWSLRQWALSVNFATGGINHAHAAGILIASLGMLEAHFRRHP